MVVKQVASAAVCLVIGLSSLPAFACGPAAIVEFTDDSPKDRFEIRNVSAGSWTLVAFTLQLEGARGDLVFDTAAGGEGLSVYQPFETAGSDVRLVRAPDVGDGDRRLDLGFEAFGPGGRFDFTIDIDDRLPRSEWGQTIVSGAEIEGAEVVAVFVGADGTESRQQGRFDSDSVARVNSGACA